MPEIGPGLDTEMGGVVPFGNDPLARRMAIGRPRLPGGSSNVGFAVSPLEPLEIAGGSLYYATDLSGGRGEKVFSSTNAQFSCGWQDECRSSQPGEPIVCSSGNAAIPVVFSDVQNQWDPSPKGFFDSYSLRVIVVELRMLTPSPVNGRKLSDYSWAIPQDSHDAFCRAAVPERRRTALFPFHARTARSRLDTLRVGAHHGVDPLLNR